MGVRVPEGVRETVTNPEKVDTPLPLYVGETEGLEEDVGRLLCPAEVLQLGDLEGLVLVEMVAEPEGEALGLGGGGCELV